MLLIHDRFRYTTFPFHSADWLNVAYRYSNLKSFNSLSSSGIEREIGLTYREMVWLDLNFNIESYIRNLSLSSPFERSC